MDFVSLILSRVVFVLKGHCEIRKIPVHSFIFLCPRDRRSVSYCFCPVCHSVILSKNFNLANNFWTENARALIFHMSIPCDNTFPWVPLFFTLWPWPSSLTHFLKTLTLLITFEQWVLELWYFTWVFFVMRPFCGYHYLLPWDLDLGVWSIFWKL